MVDFSGLKLNDLLPIYIQIIRFVKMEIISKRVVDGEEMPSRRMLSALLGVNPNTIQKAYKEMEDEGFLISFAGSKSLLSFDEEKAETIRQDFIQKETTAYIDAVKQMGLELEEANQLIRHLWESDAGGRNT